MYHSIYCYGIHSDMDVYPHHPALHPFMCSLLLSPTPGQSPSLDLGPILGKGLYCTHTHTHTHNFVSEGSLREATAADSIRHGGLQRKLLHGDRCGFMEKHRAF